MPIRASALDAWTQAGHCRALSLSKGRLSPPSLSFDKLRMPLSTG
jgi:hypothetical protein